MNFFFKILFLLFPIGVSAQQPVVKEPAGLEEAVRNARPGDTVFVDNANIWKDVQIKLIGYGDKDRPITIITKDDKAIFIEGASSLSIGGKYLHIKNFYFRDGSTNAKSVITFRLNSENLAYHCTIDNFVIDRFNQPNRFDNDSWVLLYGKNNAVVNSTFDGKINTGPVLVVELDDGRSRKNNHIVKNNHFLNRYRLGSNGGETIRIGVSRYSIYESQTQLVDNYFGHCSGETEIVSIKSGANYVARNYFFECEGSLVSRHGDNNVMDGNIFNGNSKKETGGIRIVNTGHVIKNNLFFNLKGKGFRAPLNLMNGVPNSLINRYMAVNNVDIYDNVFANSDLLVFGGGKDNERTVAPENINFHDNVLSGYGKEWYIDNNKTGGIIFKNNKRENNIVPKLPDITVYGSSLIKEKKNVRREKPLKHIVTDADGIQETIDSANDHDTLFIQLQYDTIGLKNAINITKPVVIIGEREYVLVSQSLKSWPAFFIIKDKGSLSIKNFRFLGTYKSFGNVGAGISTDKNGVLHSYKLTVKHCVFTDFNESSFAGIKAEKSSFADSVIITGCLFFNISGTGIAYNAEKDDKGIYNVENILIRDCVFSNIMGSAIDIYRGGNDESTTGPFVEIYNCTFNEVDNREQGAAIRLIGPQYIRFSGNNIFKSGLGGRSIECREFRYHDIRIEDSNLYNAGKIDVFYPVNVGRNISVMPGLIFDKKIMKNLPGSIKLKDDIIIGSHDLL